ncbi:hypothetical protein CNMCM5623_007507 [Aspergillus felis]|uniref:Cytochrome P450 n=1 Tax=Aspergillus felis TaxID=1287682 RepID=A0A8H6QYU9_9EURO|nr:hypothetical protein CNMCM5623_007507 [Aspergillus felis]KAF7181538.1 hypothetical protein CNMCM7691_000757 [Aspergillus felis]
MDAPIHTILVREASAHPVQATLLAVFLCLTTTFLVIRQVFTPIGKRRVPGKQWKLPPGSSSLPILGNLLDLKSARSDPDFEWLTSLTKYGEMTTVHLGSKTWIFLNSQRVVSEIIAKRGSITNGRSPMPVASGIVNRHGRSLILPPAGWTEKRRVMHSLLMVHRIALGECLAKTNNELADLQDVVTHFLDSIGSSMVDWFPELDALPRWLQPWRRHWEKLGQWNYEVYRSWWVPVFQKARAEVDRICGTDKEKLRLPVLDDMDQMPYTCAIIKKLLRWRPIFPLTPDHGLTSDLEIEGYHIPAGVGFVINEIPVCSECENPDVFKPERWLDGHEADVAHGLWQFGGGRRICVGYRLAQRGLFINLACLVFCYDYGASGPIDSRRLNHHSTEEPFPVKVTPRSKQHAQLIIEEASITRRGPRGIKYRLE